MTRIKRVMRLLRIFGQDTSGATAVEYVMILAGISAALVVAWTTVGSNLNTTFTNVAAGVPVASAPVQVADAGESDDSASDDDSESDNQSNDDDSDSG